MRGMLIQIACTIFLIVIPQGFAFTLAKNPGSAEKEQMNSLRPLSPEEYQKLRTQALANATTQLSPKLKNPRISQNGLSPETLIALQEQRNASRVAAMATTRASGTAAMNCRAPEIHSVNGKAVGVVFTPQPPDNTYRIEGCLFGNVRGRLHLEPHPSAPGQSALPIPLRIDDHASDWSDNEIHAHLDPDLSGIPDVPVTLVIYPGKGQRLELPGCFFVAARGESQLLNSIPSTWVTLYPSSVRSRSINELEYISPAEKRNHAAATAAGASAFIARTDSESFFPGNDVFDFSQLNPGWVVESVQLQTYTIRCPGSELSSQSLGHWDTQWEQHKLTIHFQDDLCTSYVPPSSAFSLSASRYALRVWVIGPAGTQPIKRASLQ